MSGEVFARVREGLRLRRPIGYQQLLQASERTGGRIGFIRTGNNLYLAGEEIALEEFVDPSNFESFENVIYENQGLSPDAIEEVELQTYDTAEIDTSPLLEETAFSSTPALAEAGGVAGAAAASAVPSTPILVTGATIAAGTIVVGTTVGVLSNRDTSSDHQDPVVSLPDHRYIGPGNTIDETLPVDVDDDIAREHDIAYERAQTDEDIHEADRVGANEFLSDVIHNNNPHSIAGYIGLKAKETIERQTGVIYGSPVTGKEKWVDIGGDGILIIGLISALTGME